MIRKEYVSSESMNFKNISIACAVLLVMSLGSCKNRKPQVVNDDPPPAVIGISTSENEIVKSEDQLANLLMTVIKSPDRFDDLKPYMATADVVRKLEPEFTKEKSDVEIEEQMLQSSFTRLKENFEKLNAHVTKEGIELSELELLNITRESVEVDKEAGSDGAVSIDIFQLDLGDKSNMFTGAFTILGQGADLYLFELVISYPRVKTRN